jgi:ElaB/YqjD/DUF883 family membrane-anchored ribosome-binding protein
MVLNNPIPYSSGSEDDDELDPWEFIDESAPVENVPEPEGEASADNDSNTASHTPGIESNKPVDDKRVVLEKPSVEDSEQHEAVNAVIEEQSAGCVDGSSNSAVQEAPNRNVPPADNTNEVSSNPWVPLNTQEIPSEPDSTEQHPLHQTWNFVTSSLRDIDNQNQIRQRAQTSARKLGTTAQNFWSNLQNHSQQIATTLQQHCDKADDQVREASQNIKQSMSITKDKVCRLNSEYKIHEKVAAVAALSGAVLVAAGNPRAGAGSLLVAGGALAAGEAMSAGSDRGCSTFTRDYGLREGVHLD